MPSEDVIKCLVESEPLNLVTEISDYVEFFARVRNQRYITRVSYSYFAAHPRFHPPSGILERFDRGREAGVGVRRST